MTMTQAQMAANDQSLADAHEAAARAGQTVRHALEALHSYVGDDQRTEYYGRRSVRVWGMTDEAAEQAARDDQGPLYYRSQRADYLVKLEQARAYRQMAQAEIQKYDQVWRDNGHWARFFLVPGGHIHSSMSCSTCNNGVSATEFGWLPQLSGLTEADAVKLHGAVLCTVCYPSAPVEWTNAYELAEAAKKAARCPGSGRMYDPSREHQLRQNYKWGYCTGCGTRQTLSSLGNVRAHKPPVD